MVFRQNGGALVLFLPAHGCAASHILPQPCGAQLISRTAVARNGITAKLSCITAELDKRLQRHEAGRFPWCHGSSFAHSTAVIFLQRCARRHRNFASLHSHKLLRHGLLHADLGRERSEPLGPAGRAAAIDTRANGISLGYDTSYQHRALLANTGSNGLPSPGAARVNPQTGQVGIGTRATSRLSWLD